MRWREGIAAATVAAACTPPVPPEYVVELPRELAFEIAVVEQGPWGQPLDDAERSVNEALPGDTVEVRPFLGGPGGPVDLAALDPAWFLCDDAGACLLRVDDPTALQSCAETVPLVPEEPCALPSGETLQLTLGEFVVPETADAVFAVNRAPTVGFVAGTPDGPDTDSCLSRIADRVPLRECLWAERTLALGSLAEVVETLEALGIEVELSESLETLLTVPRNHNPEVGQLQVAVDGGAFESHPVGDTVSVPAGSDIVIRHEAEDADMDEYTVIIGDEVRDVTDRLTGRWFADRALDAFEEVEAARTLRFRSDSADPVTIFFVLRDDRRSEAGGWLHFELGGS